MVFLLFKSNQSDQHQKKIWTKANELFFSIRSVDVVATTCSPPYVTKCFCLSQDVELKVLDGAYWLWILFFQGRQNIPDPGSIKGLQRTATRQTCCHYSCCPQSKSCVWGAMSMEGCIQIVLLSPLGLPRTNKSVLPWVWDSAMAWDQEIVNGNRMQQFTSIRCLAFTL